MSGEDALTVTVVLKSSKGAALLKDVMSTSRDVASIKVAASPSM